MSEATQQLPPPKPSYGDVWQDVKQYTANLSISCCSLEQRQELLADMEERRQFGIQKYGCPLQYFDGRDPLVDAYQEALDLIAYTFKAIKEDGFGDGDVRHHKGEIIDLLELAMAVRDAIQHRNNQRKAYEEADKQVGS